MEINNPQEGSSNSRIGHLTPQLESLQSADDRVLARWKDGQWYPGTIKEHSNNGKYVYVCVCLMYVHAYVLYNLPRYVILFDDGDKKVLAKSSVVQMVSCIENLHI